MKKERNFIQISLEPTATSLLAAVMGPHLNLWHVTTTAAAISTNAMMDYLTHPFVRLIAEIVG